MTEHLSVQNLELFAAGALSPPEFLSMDDHLSECESCRKQLSELKKTEQKSESLRLLLQSTEIDHLEYEDLEAYLDHRCDETDREIIESHLQDCSLCSQQVRELEKAAPAVPSFAQKVIFLWRSPEYAPPFRIAALAAVLAVLALILALTARSPDRELRAQLKEETEKNLRSQQALRTANQRISQLEKGNSPALVASLQDNTGVIGIAADGTLQGADNFPPRYRQLAKSALQEQRIPVPEWVSALRGESLTMMGKSGPAPFRLKSPLGQAVESNRPLFAWEPLPGTTQYRVDVYDTNFRPAVSSGPLRNPSWIPDRPLPRGITYLWKVTAVQNGKEILAPAPPAPEATFKVLEEDRARDLAALRKSGSHMLLGLAYADSGMIREARAEFELLSRLNSDSRIARKLLQSLP